MSIFVKAIFSRVVRFIQYYTGLSLDNMMPNNVSSPLAYIYVRAEGGKKFTFSHCDLEYIMVPKILLFPTLISFKDYFTICKFQPLKKNLLLRVQRAYWIMLD